VCSNREAHLIKEMSLEGLHFFYERTLPFIQFDFLIMCFSQRRRTVAAMVRKIGNQALAQIALNVPLNERGTYRDLASQFDVSKDTVKNLVKEGVLQIHSSAVKPYLTNANKDERFQWAVSKIE
jgi:primosomal protein N'